MIVARCVLQKHQDEQDKAREAIRKETAAREAALEVRIGWYHLYVGVCLIEDSCCVQSCKSQKNLCLGVVETPGGAR